MIALQRLNGKQFILNADFIESVESTPDTVIKLINGKKLIIQNSIEDVVRKTIKYKQLCNQTIKVIKQNKNDDENELLSE